MSPDLESYVNSIIETLRSKGFTSRVSAEAYELIDGSLKNASGDDRLRCMSLLIALDRMRPKNVCENLEGTCVSPKKKALEHRWLQKCDNTFSTTSVLELFKMNTNETLK